MSGSEVGYKSLAKPETAEGDFNAISFVVRQILSGANTSTLVQVKAVTNTGEVSPVGYVDVHPMVNMLDGYGHPIPHATIYNLPYMRLQGGTNAIILDPQVGDIGIAIFAQNDISSVKKNKAVSNPGSMRRNAMSDGLYIGGVLNGSPVQYVRFSATGIDVVSPTRITCTAPVVDVVASTSSTVTAPVVSVVAATSATVATALATITATTSATVTSPAINLGASGQSLKTLMDDTFGALYNTHTHNESGSVTGTPNQQASASHATTTVKAG